jgi:hypothetical protein
LVLQTLFDESSINFYKNVFEGDRVDFKIVNLSFFDTPIINKLKEDYSYKNKAYPAQQAVCCSAETDEHDQNQHNWKINNLSVKTAMFNFCRVNIHMVLISVESVHRRRSKSNQYIEVKVYCTL